MATSKPSNVSPKAPAAKKPRAPRKALSAADIAAQIKVKEKALEALKQRAYGSQLAEVVKSLRFDDAFKKVEAQVKGASKTAILKAIGEAAGIKRLIITQSEPVKRKPAKAK